MALSVLDIFKVGIGPSSSHTVGPMRAAARFAEGLSVHGLLGSVASVRVALHGSLGATGKGHGSSGAVLAGLEGAQPETVDVPAMAARITQIRATRELKLAGRHPIRFSEPDHLLYFRKPLPNHPNGMRFEARDAAGALIDAREYFSVGGGFIADRQADGLVATSPVQVPYPFRTGDELLALCRETGRSISALMRSNEEAFRPAAETSSALAHIWAVMQACVQSGCAHEGVLPGALNIRRRAPRLARDLQAQPQAGLLDPLVVLDWVSLYALAVNEENAAGGRVVTAPTNGAAGIIPAVMRFYCKDAEDNDCRDSRRTFLLTAGAIGLLYKQRASISGAEMGCQGEVGVACSMAAGGLAALWGGTPAQVASAAEIGMEHNLGLTCDPVGGLVQVPCIERNAIGAVKAVNAARLALHRTGAETLVTLDQVIETMRQTGLDMSSKYKETSQGGLAVNVVEC